MSTIRHLQGPHGVIRRGMLLSLPTALAAAALISTPSLAATATPIAGASQAAPAPAPASQIIMRDGGVCDPIRHMGC
jgi:hypothetical protein